MGCSSILKLPHKNAAFRLNRSNLWAPLVISIDFVEKKKLFDFFLSSLDLLSLSSLELLLVNRYVSDRKMQEEILEWIKQN